MSGPALSAALERAIAYAVTIAVLAFVATALVPEPADELFATVGYLAAIWIAIAVGVKWYLPAAAAPRRAVSPARVLRGATCTCVAVVVLAMAGAALVSQPSAEILAAVAYAGSIGIALAVGLRCILRVKI